MTLEDGHVAVCLATAFRFQKAFVETDSATLKRTYLQAAGDVMDKTLPAPEVKQALKTTTAQIPMLVEMRRQIGAVPPGLWRADKITASELGQEHYAAWRAVNRVLKHKLQSKEDLRKSFEVLDAWLAPVFEVFPVLKTEVTFFKDTLVPAETSLAAIPLPMPGPVPG